MSISLSGKLVARTACLLGSFCCAAYSQQQKLLSPADLYKSSSSAVVEIELYDGNRPIGYGSGFLAQPDGRILTNFHVIAGGTRATVRLSDKDTYELLGVLDVDQRKDIALLKIKAVDLPALPLGKSSSVKIGDRVFVLGNPRGLDRTLSEGIISGVRELEGYKWFQISAPMSPGSSGGPVFDSQGEVIAIAVAAIEGGQNLNFAIPIDYAKGMLGSNTTKPLAGIQAPLTEHTNNTVADVGASKKPLAADYDEKLLSIKRIYVDEFGPDTVSQQTRATLVSLLNGTKRFLVTENVARADAVLKGTAVEQTSQEARSYSEATAVGDLAIQDASSATETVRHARIAVRLVDGEGDVIWSTAQESNGAKYQGASADAAEKSVKQLMRDLGRIERARATSAAH